MSFALPASITAPERSSILRDSETMLYALNLYGAAGIATFGWGVCRLLDWNAAPWWPLWFCAALLVYNADRLRPDPADTVNIPLRTAATARWRTISRAVFLAAALFLIVWPLLRRDWLTLGLVLAGSFICLGYSAPLLGFRFKDVPLLKTFFAPTIVTAAVLGLPWLHLSPVTDARTLFLTALRVWSFLLFNMILCDLRDLAGDRACDIRSLPVALGERRTRWLLLALLVLIEALALAVLQHSSVGHAPAWRVACILGPLYLGGLLFCVRQPRSERFYEWAVEGMLFLPALAVVSSAL
jgi:4-hydroxybenzoate polyprenyltransferase